MKKTNTYYANSSRRLRLGDKLCTIFFQIKNALAALASKDGYTLKDSNGLYLIPKGAENYVPPVTEKLVTFSIEYYGVLGRNLVSYTAKEGMTFREWVNSKYNIHLWSLWDFTDTEALCLPEYGSECWIITSVGAIVSADDYIEPGHTYYFAD